MTGIELKQIIDNYFFINKLKGVEIGYTQVAEMLGISKQNLYSKMKSKSLDSEFCKKVEKILPVNEEQGVIPRQLEEPSTMYMKHNQPKDLKDMLIESQQEQIRLHRKLERVQDELIAAIKEKKD